MQLNEIQEQIKSLDFILLDLNQERIDLSAEQRRIKYRLQQVEECQMTLNNLRVKLAEGKAQTDAPAL